MGHAGESAVRRLMSYPPDRRRRMVLQVLASKIASKQDRRIACEVLARTMIEMDEIKKRACSASRMDGHIDRNEHHKVKGMKLGRYGSRLGDAQGVRETRRWTPPHAVTLEDKYDKMDAIDAALCNDPPSVTGIQFQQLEMRRGRIKRNKPPGKQKPKRDAKKGHRVVSA